MEFPDVQRTVPAILHSVLTDFGNCWHYLRVINTFAKWARWSAGLVGRHVKCRRRSGTEEETRGSLARKGKLSLGKLFAEVPSS